MAKRTSVRARPRVRRVKKKTTKTRGRSAAAPPPRKRGPKKGTPSPLRYSYTPEFIADCRRRYEGSRETIADIGRDYGIEVTTIRRLARENGWVRERCRVFDLSPTARLRLDAERALAGFTVDMAPPDLSAPSAAPMGGGEARAAEAEPGATIATANWLERRLRDELFANEEEAKELRGRRRKTSDSVRIARTLQVRIARTLQSLTATLNAIQRIRDGKLEVPHHDYVDDFPADIDAFRDELARQIDEFVRSRTQPDDTGGAA